ncbi:MAG: arginine deiminase-related protein [Flammeovirgaceae bacterium]|nr:arginine deiminase-related protein [Flammeovirgaceae bacterium]MDW8287382.1 arginine deiminase-related protein [Flammeovirgaceae bacterium]
MKNSTKHILMVRPASFGFNEETAKDNAFQNATDPNSKEVSEKALQEFDGFVKALKEAGVNVIVIHDTPIPRKPDAIFPNNWFTSHADGKLFYYPMKSPLRRLERRKDIFETLSQDFVIQEVIDLSHYEEQDRFLEGTGSMIFDRIHKICYACISQRTDKGILEELCGKLGYEMVVFTAKDAQGKPIYHTNVMMALGTELAIICGASIPDNREREMVFKRLKDTGKVIIDVTLAQMLGFTCNVLEATNSKGETLLTMSERAYKTFTPEQLKTIEKYAKIVKAPLYTIEEVGGGGSRCMMAEIYFQERTSRRI